MNATRFLLLDRDGVINGDRPDYVLNSGQVVMEAGSAGAIARLTRAGVGVLVITNQACIGKGLLDEAGLAAIHDTIHAAVRAQGGRIDAFYHCPHVPADHCPCRKPQPGLILQAQRAWGFRPEETWLVGDAVRDMEAAAAAGCRGALVLSGKGAESALQLPTLPVFANLWAFVDFFLGAAAPLEP